MLCVSASLRQSAPFSDSHADKAGARELDSDLIHLRLCTRLRACKNVVERLLLDETIQVDFGKVADALPELIDELPRGGRISFRRLTSGLVERLEVIVRFLALLELFKQGLVELEQAERFGDIDVVWTGGEGALDDLSIEALSIDDYEG